MSGLSEFLYLHKDLEKQLRPKLQASFKRVIGPDFFAKPGLMRGFIVHITVYK